MIQCQYRNGTGKKKTGKAKRQVWIEKGSRILARKKNAAKGFSTC